MAVFAVNQPITTTVPTVTVENKLTAGPHHFQLVVENSAGVQSDPMKVTVVVSQGILPIAGAVKGKAPARATKKPTKSAVLKDATAPLAKAPPQVAAPAKENPAKEKSAKTPAKKRARKKTS
ncbi:MAG: hypothetical protein DMG54_17375 [Acidobacteria bacterium]|nr:MAG: hypothetical protein DMG53_26375 [Acidobacteriota bacterium]PYU42060.1 MAG: hypothetical protein DMG54_17375 [Acidobacteriota bacterium]PYU73434.1 MAG: hypothetical protein DMG52_14885 [Acidobacteriota bacterium]HMC26961.1 hypothetical protein [Verrucomicrobiae bacterium]